MPRTRKLLQSEGQLTNTSTGKDPQSGRLVTNEYHVEGPVMIFLTSTSPKIDEELLNCCIVLTVDEDREQTRAIHRLQREAETLEGLIAREERAAILRRHRNAQRLLRPMRVINPYAPALTSVDGRTRTPRDHMKYLALVRSIALLHQHQRPRKTNIVAAHRLHRGRGARHRDCQTIWRRKCWVAHSTSSRRSRDGGATSSTARSRASARRVRSRESTSGPHTARCARGPDGTDVQVKKHLFKLVTMEYVLVHRGGRGQSFVSSCSTAVVAATAGRSRRASSTSSNSVSGTARQRSGTSHIVSSTAPPPPSGPAANPPGGDGRNGSKPTADKALREARVYKLKKHIWTRGRRPDGSRRGRMMRCRTGDVSNGSSSSRKCR